MIRTNAVSLLRDSVIDAELMALLWLLAEGGVPLSVIGGASLDARSGAAGAILSLTPGRAWVVIDADQEPPTTQRLAALLQGGVGLGLTWSAADLKSVLKGGGPLEHVPDDGVRRLGVILVLDAVDSGLRCRAAHYLRPSERDGQGHVQRRPPAVLAAWDPSADGHEHYAWGITPELADRVDRAQADFEDRHRDRTTFLQDLSGSDPSPGRFEERLSSYLESEPDRVPAPSRAAAQPSPFGQGLIDPHEH